MKLESFASGFEREREAISPASDMKIEVSEAISPASGLRTILRKRNFSLEIGLT
jgi:hypothetical protein